MPAIYRSIIGLTTQMVKADKPRRLFALEVVRIPAETGAAVNTTNRFTLLIPNKCSGKVVIYEGRAFGSHYNTGKVAILDKYLLYYTFEELYNTLKDH